MTEVVRGRNDMSESSASRCSENGNLEVYVQLSAFKDIGQSVQNYIGQRGADGVREMFKRVGVCHYLIAFRPVGKPNSDYHVFDFGPLDLEVAFSNRDKGLVRVEEEVREGMKRKKGKSKAVKGEVRERFVKSLCKDHLQSMLSPSACVCMRALLH